MDSAGFSRAMILGRKVARNLGDSELFEAFKNSAKTIRSMLVTAAGESLFVAALDSAPQQEAFSAAAEYMGIPDANPIFNWCNNRRNCYKRYVLVLVD